jgi:YfiH family protein
VRFLHRDTLATAHGAVAVGFTEALPIITDVREARATVLADVGAVTGRTPWVMHQVHGADLHVVADDEVADHPVLDVDALATTRGDVALMARAADCVPLLLASPEGAVSAVHAGRRGLALGVVPEAVRCLRELGGTRLTAWIGPHICGRCYEVPEEMREDIAAAVPATRSTTSWDTPALDLGAGVLAQLADAGVPAVEVSGCTREDDTLHSYRRDGSAAGRLAGVVWRTA